MGIDDKPVDTCHNWRVASKGFANSLKRVPKSPTVRTATLYSTPKKNKGEADDFSAGRLHDSPRHVEARLQSGGVCERFHSDEIKLGGKNFP
jgi:hypothetical protein